MKGAEGMNTYHRCTLEGASAIELVVALYDGIIRFLHSAAEAADRGDTRGRRVAVKRALDIIIHLQASLRMDVGGEPAQVLSEFYAATFAQILQASQSSSRRKFEHAMSCVRNVRDAWKQASFESTAASTMRSAVRAHPASDDVGSVLGNRQVGHWTA
jgi:flagellar secretion chaperone FliS